MRLYRYLIFLFITTSLGLLYTHQQFLAIKANYNITNYESRVSHLLDRNKKLMYNVASLESPANLESKLSASGVDYDVPVQWAVVKRWKSRPSYKLAKVTGRRNVVMGGIINFLNNFLTPKVEARVLEN